MAQTRTRKIRDLRKRGKARLVRVNDQLNSLTWEMFERNASLNDVNTTRAVAVLDDALSLIQRAGALLNSVHVEMTRKRLPGRHRRGSSAAVTRARMARASRR